MKFKHTFTTACLAVTLGLGVGIGLKSNSVKQAKAEMEDGFYLCGDFVGWEHGDSKKLTQESTNVYVYDGLYLDWNSNYHFQAFNVESGSEHWDYAATSVNVLNKVADWSGLNWDETSNTACIKFASGIRIVKFSLNISTKVYSFDWSAPIIKINGTPTRMSEMNPENSNEYLTTINSVPFDASIAIETADGTSLSNYSGDGNNRYNELGTEKIIAGGNLPIYFNRTTTSTWIGGYSSELNTFANGLLSDTISGSTCANPTTVSKNATNVWAYYQNEFTSTLSADDRTTFQAAVNEAKSRGSIPSALNNKLVEAAGRYIHLVNHYSLEAFGDVTIPGLSSNAKISPIAFGEESNTTALVIAIVSVTSLLAVGGFLFLRKRKSI